MNTIANRYNIASISISHRKRDATCCLHSFVGFVNVRNMNAIAYHYTVCFRDIARSDFNNAFVGANTDYEHFGSSGFTIRYQNLFGAFGIKITTKNTQVSGI